MKIAVLTTCFNEEAILPFFLSHYQHEGWEVRVLLDRETTDNSKRICESFSNVQVLPCGMKAGLQEIEKVEILQTAFDEMVKEGFDWLAVLDSDEFIVPQAEMAKVTAKEFLEIQDKFECLISRMFPVYRHVTDKDLDPTKPALPQRLHGGQSRDNEIKPNVLRAIPDVKLTIGMHTLGRDYRVSPYYFTGSHWADADPSLSVPRRLSRQARFSKDNLANGWGIQHQGITEYSVRAESAAHLYDPPIRQLDKVAR